MRPGLDGSDAGALVRLAQGTTRTPGTHVGNPDQWWPEWSTLVLSSLHRAGLPAVHENSSRIPARAKAVLFGLISLVCSPYSMLVQPPWRRLLEITHLLLLTHSVGLCSG